MWPPRVFRAALCALLGRAALCAPRVFRAPQGPVAREARASLRSAPRLEARPCPPVPPAPSTPVGLGRCSAALRVVSKPGQAPPPPTGTAATSDECGDTLLASTSTRLKPPAPLHGQTVATLKPAAPLLTTFSLFERVSRSQRRCRFHSAAHVRSQRCHRFHSDGVRCPRTRQNSPSTARMHPRTRKNSPSALKTAQNEWFLSSRANFFTEVPLKGQRWANFVSAQAGTDLLRPSQSRNGHEKALPKECLVEMQNPHRWIAPRGAAARPEGLEPPTF